MNVVIAGGGIAGCVTALGLRRLGYEVLLVHKPRPFEAYEGFSERTVDALRRVGCRHALAAVGPLSRRSSVWNGVAREVNAEYLTFRPRFDEALLRDACEHGVEVMAGSLVGAFEEEGGTLVGKVKTAAGERTVRGDAAVDARGRFTPYAKAYANGPQSYALLQKLDIPGDAAPRTTLHAVGDGWVWQAAIGGGTGYLQMACSRETAQKVRRFDDLLPLFREHYGDLWVLESARPKGELIRRDAYGKLHDAIVKGRLFHVGDAASSVDPLSGNGVFQALSMATVLPCVIHTVLTRNESDSGTAATFYRERVRDLFRRFGRTGRDFYRAETRFDGPFWDERRQWPEEEVGDGGIRIEERATIIYPFVEKQKVVVTPENPNGVAFVERVALVPVVERLARCAEAERVPAFRALSKGMDAATSARLLRWLHEHGMVGAPFSAPVR